MEILCLYVLFYIMRTTATDRQLDTSNSEPETVNTESEIDNTEPEAVNRRLYSLNMGTETVNTRPKTVNTGPKTVNTGPKAKNAGFERVYRELERMNIFTNNVTTYPRAYNNPYHPEDDEIRDEKYPDETTNELIGKSELSGELSGELALDTPDVNSERVKINGIWYRPDDQKNRADIWSLYRKERLRELAKKEEQSSASKSRESGDTLSTDELLEKAS